MNTLDRLIYAHKNAGKKINNAFAALRKEYADSGVRICYLPNFPTDKTVHIFSGIEKLAQDAKCELRLNKSDGITEMYFTYGDWRFFQLEFEGC